MQPVRTFTVTPSLPTSLEGLRTLAFNLRWAWNHDAIELFRRLDSELSETAGHSPVLMLGTVDQAKLEAATSDEGFLAHLKRVSQDFDAYRAGQSAWFRRVVERPHSASRAQSIRILKFIRKHAYQPRGAQSRTDDEAGQRTSLGK